MKDRTKLNKAKAEIRASLKRKKITRFDHVVEALARQHMKKRRGAAKGIQITNSMLE